MHFAVAVICDHDQTVKELLAPYQENNMCDVDKKYLEFVDMEEAVRSQYENGITPRVVMPDGRLLCPWDEMFRVRGFGLGYDTHKVPENLEIRQFRFKEIFETFDCFTEYFAEERDPETGKYGYWENPNAKWDWYAIGGRWRGNVRAHRGWVSPELGIWTHTQATAANPSTHFDSACLGDLIWCKDEIFAKEAKEMYRSLMSGESKFNPSNPLESESWVKRCFNNEEEYVYVESHMWWGSVVTPDGKWHELGRLGDPPYEAPAGEYYQWAKSFKERFVDPYPPSYTLTVVDCHI